MFVDKLSFAQLTEIDKKLDVSGTEPVLRMREVDIYYSIMHGLMRLNVYRGLGDSLRQDQFSL